MARRASQASRWLNSLAHAVVPGTTLSAARIRVMKGRRDGPVEQAHHRLHQPNASDGITCRVTYEDNSRVGGDQGLASEADNLPAAVVELPGRRFDEVTEDR
jgi:hypothetical protein